MCFSDVATNATAPQQTTPLTTTCIEPYRLPPAPHFVQLCHKRLEHLEGVRGSAAAVRRGGHAYSCDSCVSRILDAGYGLSWADKEEERTTVNYCAINHLTMRDSFTN